MSTPSVAWIKQTALMNTTGNDQVPTMAVDSSGNVYVAYQTAGTVSGGTLQTTDDIVVFKMDTSGNIVWIKQTITMNSIAGNDITPSISVDSSGNVYVSFQSSGTVSGGSLSGSNDIVVFKMDTNGNMIWIKETNVMNSTLSDTRPIMTVDSSGNVYVSYQTAGTVSGGTFMGGANDIVVFKMDTNGNVTWIKETNVMNTILAETFVDISVDSSGNVYVSYQTTGTVSGGTFLNTSDIVVFKMDTNGNMIWIKQTALMNTTISDVRATVSIDSSGNVYVSFQSNGTVSGGNNIGSNDIVVFKMDTNGNMVWTKQTAVMNTLSIDRFPIIALDSSGNVYVSYQTTGTVSGGTLRGSGDVVIFKMDTNGNLIWIKQEGMVNTANDDQLPQIALDQFGSIYISYYTSTSVSGGTFMGGANDIVVFKMTQSPSAPTALSATSGNQQLTISFTPGDNGGSAFTNYQYSIDNGSSFTPFSPATGAVSSVTITGLTNGTSYSVQLKAVNANGASPASATVTATPSTTPSAPTALSATSGDQQLIISFTPGSDGGSAITNYQYSIDNGSSFTPFSPATGAVSSVTITGLTNGTSYSVQLKAVNANGVGTASATVTGTPFTTPSAPTALSATAGNQQLTIAFTPGSNGGSAITNYQYSTDNGSTFTAFSPATGAVSSVTITGLTNGTSYSVQLKAVNANGVGTASATVTATPSTTPSAPTALSATSGDQQLTISFTPGSNGGSTITNYQYSIDNGSSFTPFSPATGAVSSVTITGLTNDTSYSVQLKAVNANGVGTASTTVTGTPSTTPSAPTALSATAGNQQLTIAFTPGNNGGSAITNYQYSTDNGSTFTAFSPATGAVSSVTITGLTNGTSYSVQLKAVNANGASAASATVTSTPVAPISAPVAPTALYTVTGDQQLLVYFTPGSNNGSAITNYQYSTNNGSSFTAFSPATGAVSVVTITGLTNGVAYSIQLKAVNAGGASAASATVTGTPASATSAVAAGPSGINDYIGAQTLTNDTQKAATTIDMRTAIKAATYPDNATKAASQIAYIDSMRTQIGATSYTMPSSNFSSFLASFVSSASGISAQPVQVYYPVYTSQTATVDVSAASPTNYVHVEIPVGYSVTLQNGAASLKLTNNGTSYVDDSETVYTVNTAILLGSKTFTIIGIGSILVDGEDSNAVECLTAGTELLTPSGNVAIDSLRQGDHVITGNKEVVPIEHIHKIVVVNATDKNAPYVIEKEAFGVNCPPNKLVVSPRHAIQLRPGLWEIPREAAKENKRVYQNKDAIGSKVIYYHVTLPNYERDTIVANGQITEALNDGKVEESYAWNAAQRGYVRNTKPVDAVAKK